MKAAQPFNPETKEDLHRVLAGMWPEGRVSRERLFEDLDIDNPLDRAKLLSILGVRAEFGVDEVADCLWRHSNYADLEEGLDGY